MHRLKVGIGDADDSRTAMPGVPAVCFPSTGSFARLLTADNRTMLRLIAERAPESLDELVELTGQTQSVAHASQTGELRHRPHRAPWAKDCPTLLCDRIELVLPLTGQRLPGTTARGGRA